MNISNRIYYKKELAKTLENLENDINVNDTLLDELQSKIYLLMKQKYYPEFRNYPEFQKVLLKSDLFLKGDKNSNQSSPIVQESTSPVNQQQHQESCSSGGSDLGNIDEDFDSSSLLNESLFDLPGKHVIIQLAF